VSDGRYAAALIVLAAAALMAPELATGISLSDSVQYNLVWTEQFVGQVRAGQLYPRWLPDAWGGLGSPTFYIYPPLYFWLASAVDTLTLRSLSAEKLVPLTSLLVLAGAGLNMRAWLREQAPAGWASAGAIAYMTGPYHIYDIYVRGALAETCTFAILPLLLLAFRRLSQGRRLFFLVAVASYGLLILSHLPTALLISILVLPAYVLFEARRSVMGPIAFLGHAAAAGLLGIGVAAAYLVPALFLTPFISYDAFFGSFYQPESWLFLTSRPWPLLGPVVLTMLVCAAAMLMAVQVPWKRPSRDPDTILWCAIGLATVILASGVAPFLWKLPLIAKVQFPFRLLVITEFALITAVVLARPRITSPFFFGAALSWLTAMIIVTEVAARVVSVDAGAKARKLADLREEYRDAPEYLPPGYPIPVSDAQGIPDSYTISLPQTPPARLDPPAGQVRVGNRPDGGAEVLVRARQPGRLSLRRFYFPHWRVHDGEGRDVGIAPDARQLLSWSVPAGLSTYSVAGGSAPGERLGWSISALALALLLMLAAIWQRSRAKGEEDIHQFRLEAGK
jgi:hypothetical protein